MGDELMGDIHTAGDATYKSSGCAAASQGSGAASQGSGVMQQVKATKGSVGRQCG